MMQAVVVAAAVPLTALAACTPSVDAALTSPPATRAAYFYGYATVGRQIMEDCAGYDDRFRLDLRLHRALETRFAERVEAIYDQPATTFLDPEEYDLELRRVRAQLQALVPALRIEVCRNISEEQLGNLRKADGST